MKTRRIVSLLLALLMIVTALPLTAMITFAAEEPNVATASAGTPGTAPSTLPNGKTYAGVTLFGHDAAAKCREKGDTSGWFGDVGTGVAAMLQDDAEGIMFRIDTSEAAVAEDEILKMVFAISLSFTRKDGTTGSTYLLSSPKQAAGWSANVVTTAADVSTWYYSQDGATWQSTSETGTSASYLSLPVGKKVTYVYIPMSSFWTKEGENFLTTGTNVKTDPTLPWTVARNLIDDNYYFGSVRYLFSGNAWKDENTKIDQWQIVDHVQPVSDMITAPFMRSDVNGSGVSAARPNWLGGGYYLNDAVKNMKTAKGLMVEIDTTHVADGSDTLGFAVMMSMNKTDGISNAYLLSTFGQANSFGTSYAANSKGEAAKDQSSVLYWSEDGVNWTAVSSSDANPALPKSRAKAYVYIPFESFWTRHAEKDISGVSTDSTARVDTKDMLAALGDSWTFGYLHVYFANSNAANAGATLSNWQFVYDSTDTEHFNTQLPVVGQTQITQFSAVTNPSWTGGGNLYTTATESFRNADGVMFKMNSAGLTNPNFSLMLAANTPSGGNGSNNYILATPGKAADFKNSKVASDAVSTWYYSVDGTSWTALSADMDFGLYMPATLLPQQEIYVYIPFTSFWSRYGEEYISGKASAASTSHASLRGDRWLALMGDNMNMAYVHAYYAADKANLKEFSFVQFGEEKDPAGAYLPATLPDGSYYRTENMFSNSAFSFSRTLNHATWTGTFTGSSGDHLNNADGIMFKLDSSTAATGTDALSLWFTMSVAGKNGRTTYLMSNVGSAPNYSEAVAPSGVTSVWYWSSDGETWHAIYSSASSFPVNTFRDECYVYIPYSSMYVKSGETFLSTGTHNRTQTGTDSNGNPTYTLHDTAATFARATEITGGWKNAGQFRISIANTVMGNSTYVTDFRFVYGSQTPFAAIPETKLPTVGTTLTTPVTVATSVRPDWTNASAMHPTVEANMADSDGIMFELDTTAISGIDAPQFTVMLSANTSKTTANNYLMATAGYVAIHGQSTAPADALSVWYWSEDGVNWRPYVADETSPYMTLSAKRTKAYIYIPYTSFWSRWSEAYITGQTTTINASEPSVRGDRWLELMKQDGFNLAYVHGYYTTGTTTAAISLQNLCFVTMDRTLEDATKAPTTLPDTGKEYVALPMLKPEYNEQKYVEGNYWQGNEILSANVVPSTFEYANGVMMKIDSSAVAAGTDIANLSLILQVILPNGKDTYLCSSPGRAVGYGEATLPEGVTATWYVSNDGKNWTTLTGTGANASISAQRGILYLYIPTSSMYVKCGETYLLTGSHNRTDTGEKDTNGNTIWDLHETVLSYSEANALCGGFTRFGMVNLMINGNTVGKELTVSDISLVGTPLRVFQNSSISMTDDLAYNLYAKLPEGAENAQVVFTMGDVTYTATGITEANGMTRYTFSNILPQQVGLPITMTWTATVNGETQTETYTDSVLLYLKKILNNSTYATWHDMAKAILHYGAAAQSYAGQEGTLVNNGIGATTASVDLLKLPYTATNYNSEIWTTYALRLESSINLKVGVNAPNGIKKVRYTVGDRSGIATIVEGYVNIPVHAYEIMETITLRLYNGTTTTLDAPLEISASAYIREQAGKTEDAKLLALLQAIGNYAQEATLLKGTRATPTLASPTLTQIELGKGGGMCYVVQMTDGRFIVVDGGTKTATHTANLWKYLVEKSGGAKPVIAAWMFTHQHGDHVDNAFYMLQNFADKMEVQSFAYTFVTEDQLAVNPGDESTYPNGIVDQALGNASFKDYKENDWAVAQSVENTFNNKILPLYPNATCWDMVRGDSKTIGDVKIDVLLSARDVCRDNIFELNDFSAAWKMTFNGGTTFLVLGDCSADRLQYLATNNAADIDCDILQATHHGLAGSDKDMYTKVTPTVSLVSTREDVLTSDYNSYYNNDANTYLRSVSTVYYNDQAPIITIGANGSTDTVLWSEETAADVEVTVAPYLALVHGNKLSAASDNSQNRAAASKNIYLTAGQRFHLKDNSTYKWAVKLNTSEEYGNNVGNYLPEGGWSTVDTFKAVQDGWYSIVVVKLSNENFDFNVDSMNLYDYVEVLDAEDGVAANAMLTGNRNVSTSDRTATDGTTEKNLYLKAGYVVSLKDSANYKIAIKKAGSEALGTCTGSWLTGGWSTAPLTIVEDGFYCIVVRNAPAGTGTAFDFTGKNLYDYVQIEKAYVELEPGQQISSPASMDRATATLNVYLRAGQTTHLKLVGGDYVYGYNLQRLKDGSNAETVPASNLDGKSWRLSGWGTSDYAVTQDGWYCIIVARTDGVAFDLGGADPIDLFEYIEIIPTPAA